MPFVEVARCSNPEPHEPHDWEWRSQWLYCPALSREPYVPPHPVRRQRWPRLRRWLDQ